MAISPGVKAAFLKAGGPVLLVVAVLGVIGTSYAVDAFRKSSREDQTKTVASAEANSALLAVYCIAIVIACVMTAYTFKQGKGWSMMSKA
jgi:hypothetical protein